MNYGEKLKDPRWQKRRLEIMQRDKFSCVKCGDNQTELHVHHKKYFGEPWESDDDSLETMCKHCHLIEEVLKKGMAVDYDIIRNVKLLHTSADFVPVLTLIKATKEGKQLFAVASGVLKNGYYQEFGADSLDKYVDVINEFNKIKNIS